MDYTARVTTPVCILFKVGNARYILKSIKVCSVDFYTTATKIYIFLFPLFFLINISIKQALALPFPKSCTQNFEVSPLYKTINPEYCTHNFDLSSLFKTIKSKFCTDNFDVCVFTFPNNQV